MSNDVHKGKDGRYYVARPDVTPRGPVYWWRLPNGEDDDSTDPADSPYAFATESEAEAKAKEVFADSGRLKEAFKKIFE